MSPLLEVRNAMKRFGALTVTDDVTIEVREGELHALIGPNGAGKSCLLAEITGELRLNAGEIHFRGRRIDQLPVHRRARAGVVRAYQVPQSFGSLTVHENVAVAEIARRRTGWRLWQRPNDDANLQQGVVDWLREMDLAALAARPAATLGHGEKRLLELAISFAAQPELLLLDEPLAGLGTVDSAIMVELLRTLKRRCPMLLVEHDVDAVFSLADRISVLVNGRIIASGSADEIRDNNEVRAAYLGEAAA